MKVWIYKYALTKGIFELDAEIVDGIYARGKLKAGSLPIFTRDWARGRALAAGKAEQMRQRKIASLKKSIAKLEALSFEEK